MEEQDLTTNMQEMLAQMAQMRTALINLQARADKLSQPGLVKPSPTAVTTTRRKTLRRLGLALLGGTAVATVIGIPAVEAKVIVHPQTNGLANKAGMVAIPPGAAAPTGTYPYPTTFGLIASGDLTPLDTTKLPFGQTGLVGSGNYHGVYGLGQIGVYGSGTSTGVYGNGTTTGVYGESDDTGVEGKGSIGVSGTGIQNGVYGKSSNIGVVGNGGTTGVQGTSITNLGVFGFGAKGGGNFQSENGYGVGAIGGLGYINGNMASNTSIGLVASTDKGVNLTNLFAPNQSVGLYATADNSQGRNPTAAYFDGTVRVNGTLSKASGTFKIDHPIDPDNKYLYHSFVESPDMMNIYDGVVTLDSHGEAAVTMPDWFEALNCNFRYQLTCLGQYAPVFIAEEIKELQFKIAGGPPGQKVSWQVTGIRQDAWAKAHPIQVEENKTEAEQGKYLHPEVFGKSAEFSVAFR